MSELLKLAERCEAARGPDPVLDGQIGAAVRFGYEAIGPEHELEADDEDGSISVYVGKRKVKRFHAPKFTASLDAAKTLWPGEVPHLIPSDPRICTAMALRARATLTQGEDNG